MPSVASAAKKLDSRSGSISAPALRLTTSIIAMPMRASCIAAMASTAATMSTTSNADTRCHDVSQAAPVEQQREQGEDKVTAWQRCARTWAGPAPASRMPVGLKARPTIDQRLHQPEQVQEIQLVATAAVPAPGKGR